MLIRRDQGQLTLLMLFYALIVTAMFVVGLDVSIAFLAQRGLSNAADGAALAAAQAVDRSSLYQIGINGTLPLSPVSVDAAVARYLTDSGVLAADPGLRWRASVQGGTVTVALSRSVRLPFVALLGAVSSRYAGGAVTVAAAAHATARIS
jgi:uncharacterized membrane protein